MTRLLVTVLVALGLTTGIAHAEERLSGNPIDLSDQPLLVTPKRSATDRQNLQVIADRKFVEQTVQHMEQVVTIAKATADGEMKQARRIEICAKANKEVGVSMAVLRKRKLAGWVKDMPTCKVER